MSSKTATFDGFSVAIPRISRGPFLHRFDHLFVRPLYISVVPKVVKRQSVESASAEQFEEPSFGEHKLWTLGLPTSQNLWVKLTFENSGNCRPVASFRI